MTQPEQIPSTHPDVTETLAFFRLHHLLDKCYDTGIEIYMKKNANLADKKEFLRIEGILKSRDARLILTLLWKETLSDDELEKAGLKREFTGPINCHQL